ncbi:MAG: alpha-amylase family glycosyl hydrolase, partial [Candidatus Hodarchaeales archaeon]
RESKNSPKRHYYVWSDTDKRYSGVRIIFTDTESSNWTFDSKTGQFYWHRFFSHQPDLNFESEEVQEEMLKVIDFWLGKGLDGFRVDAVPYLFEQEGTSCESLPATHGYVKKVRNYIDTKYGFLSKILLAEANQMPEDTLPYFGDGKDEFHMAFHFPLMPRLFLALARQDATPIVNIINKTKVIPEFTQWCTFLRNHDELSLEMVTEEERNFLWDFYAPDPRMRLNLGIRRRLAPLLNNDRKKIELMNSLLFTLPGTPVIWMGDEIGMGDNIDLDDRNGVRTPMQWSDGKNAGFSEASPESLFLPVIQSEEYGPDKINVLAQQKDPSSLLNFYKRLIRARRKNFVLHNGNIRFLRTNDKGVLAFIRQFEDSQYLFIHSLLDRPKKLEIYDHEIMGAKLNLRFPTELEKGLVLQDPLKFDLR